MIRPAWRTSIALHAGAVGLLFGLSWADPPRSSARAVGSETGRRTRASPEPGHTASSGGPVTPTRIGASHASSHRRASRDSCRDTSRHRASRNTIQTQETDCRAPSARSAARATPVETAASRSFGSRSPLGDTPEAGEARYRTLWGKIRPS